MYIVLSSMLHICYLCMTRFWQYIWQRPLDRDFDFYENWLSGGNIFFYD